MSTTGSSRPIDRLVLGEAVVDLTELRVSRGDEVHALTPLEADVVRYLWDRSGAVVSRDDLLRDVWRYRPGLSTRAVDNTVSRLRGKIEPVPGDAAFLRGVYGRGYVLMGARPAAPRPTPLPAAPTNLTPDPTSFVGRQDALAHLDAAGPGLTTLTGPAGVGKTRLIRTWALAHADAFPGGTWEVALADHVDLEGVSAALLRAIGAAPSATVEEAVAALGRALIVLDGAEHLVEAVAPAVARWVAAAPDATWVATSRRPLDLRIERRLPVDPLSATDALALVSDRARALGVEIERDPALTALIDRADRLPLALELIARRLGVFTAAQILERLDRGLGALGEGPRGGSPHHTSLDRAIAWSWDLLAPDEVALLWACAVFRGGFGLEAVEEVTGDAGAGPRLERLVDHALVRVDAPPGARRFRLYESVRTFAEVRARAEGVAGREERHARYFARWGFALATEVAVTEDSGRAQALADELDNLVAAAEWLEGVDGDDFARAVVAVGRAALERGPLDRALALATRALDRGADAARIEWVRLVRAELCFAVGRSAAEDLGRLVHAADEAVALMATRLHVATAQQGDHIDERRLLIDALARAEAIGNDHLVARLLVAISLTGAADPAASAARAEQVAQRIGYRAVENRALGLQGYALFEAGDLPSAERKLRQALDVAGPRDRSDASRNLAWAVAMGERVDEAVALLEADVAWSRGRGLGLGAAQSELMRIELLQWVGRWDDARALEDLAAWFHARGQRRNALVARAVAARVLQDCGRLDAAQAAFDAVLADAGADRYQRAALFADRAAVAFERGDDDRAIADFDEALALATVTGSRWEIQVTRIRGAAARALGDPRRARLELEEWAGWRPAWVDVARDLILGLCDPRAPTSAERLRRSAAASPVRWLRPLARRLGALVHPSG